MPCRVPAGVDEAARAQAAARRAFNIEIGAGLGPLAGKIWRVGLMGSGSTRSNVVAPDRRACRNAARVGAMTSRCARDRRRGIAGAARRRLRLRRLHLPHAARRARRCATSNPSLDRVHGAARARSARAAACRVTRDWRWVAVRAHLAEPEEGGDRHRGRRVLAARRHGLRAAARVDGGQLGARRVRARRQHHHPAAREEPLSLAVEEPDPQGARRS